jgi:hypothetical protein
VLSTVSQVDAVDAVDQVDQVDQVDTPVLLLPELIERMITERERFQVAKFRTTCTDCVPNF